MVHGSKISRRQFLSLSGATLGGLVLTACTRTTGSQAVEKVTAEPAVRDANDALQRLQSGNLRYATNKTIDLNQTPRRRVEVARGQHPFATVLGCVDSRVPPELIFDRGLGDLFVIRTAGQVLDQAVLGSIEFGFMELGIHLIVVLGHENCGAVKATIEAVEKKLQVEGSVGYLVRSLTPAVEKAMQAEPAETGEEPDVPFDLVAETVDTNIRMIVDQLAASAEFSEAIVAGTLRIVGGRYDLDTGLVEFIA
jgi:carbonic anhydrase